MGLFNKSSNAAKKQQQQHESVALQRERSAEGGEGGGAVGEDAQANTNTSNNPTPASGGGDEQPARARGGLFSKIASSNGNNSSRAFGFGPRHHSSTRGGEDGNVSADGQPRQQQQQQQQLAPAQQLAAPSQPRTRPPTIQDVIGRFCGVVQEDWNGILDLADVLSTSEQASKEAAECLRKELKYGVPMAQDRAMRLLVVLMRNTSDRFRLQIADKKFLKAVDGAFNSRKNDAGLKARILKAVAILAYESQGDADLQPIVSLYIKIKPPDLPVNGIPQDKDDDSFTPVTARPHRRGRGAQQFENPNAFDPRVQVEQTIQRASVAKAEAGMLHDSLAYTAPEDLSKNEIVQEFYPKVLAWQDFVVQQIPWAQAEADRVHREKGEAAEHGRKTENSEGQRNEDAAQTRLDEAAPEEKMLDVLLAANSEIIEALGDYHRLEQQASRKAQEEEELRITQERSKTDTRHDRSLNPYLASPNKGTRHESSMDPGQGIESNFQGMHLATPSSRPFASGSHAGSSSSRSVSPPPAAHVYDDRDEPLLSSRRDKGGPDWMTGENGYLQDRFHGNAAPEASGSTSPKVTMQSRNPYARLSAEPEEQDQIHHQPAWSPTLEGYTVDEPQQVVRDVDGQQHHQYASRNPFLSMDTTNVVSQGALTRRDSEELVTPKEPSAKALGKLRRVSGGQAMEAEEQQRRLEEQLRQRYQRNHATKQSAIQASHNHDSTDHEEAAPSAAQTSDGPFRVSVNECDVRQIPSQPPQLSILDEYDPYRAH